MAEARHLGICKPQPEVSRPTGQLMAAMAAAAEEPQKQALTDIVVGLAELPAETEKTAPPQAEQAEVTRNIRRLTPMTALLTDAEEVAAAEAALVDSAEDAAAV